MQSRERRETDQNALFRTRLDQIVDLNHALVKLARSIDWLPRAELRRRLNGGPGRPPLPTRLMAGLAILKHMHDLSDEALCDRWIENPYYRSSVARSSSSTSRLSTGRR
jgi:transposase, IS5 family